MRAWTAVVADEDSASADVIRETLDQLSCDVVSAATAEEIVAAARVARCGLVVVAAPIRGMDPRRLCQELHTEPTPSRVVFLVDHYGADTLTAAFSAGADDALAKPLIPAEVVARLRQAIEILALEDGRRTLDGEGALLAEITSRARFHSRRYLQAQLRNELTRAKRFAHALAMILVEVGGGAANGDERDIRACCLLLADMFRTGVDWIARHDDHSLALVLPETGLAGALRTAERLRDRLLETGVARVRDGSPRKLSVHVGVSAIDGDRIATLGEEPSSSLLLDATVAYLHDAARKGPNQIAGGPAPHV